MNEKLMEIYSRMRDQCLADFQLYGTLGSRCLAIKPNLAPIRFSLDNMMLPLPLLGLHDSGHMTLKAAVNIGQIVAVFVGSEGYMDDPYEDDPTIDWANIHRTNFLWFEIISRYLQHYEAFHIIRSGVTPELRPMEKSKIKVAETPYGKAFRLHS